MAARHHQLAHDGRLRAAVVSVEADDDAVVLARAHVVVGFGEVEEGVVHLEDKGRGRREDISEHD